MNAAAAAIDTAINNFARYRERRAIHAALAQNILAQKFALGQEEAFRMQRRQLEAEFALLQNRLSSV